VSFILKERNSSSLEAQVESGISPSNYLSVSQFAAQYGQPAFNINALTSYLAGFGIKTDVYADDVDVMATGTAGEFDQALTITEENVHVPQQAGFGGFGPIRAQDVYTNEQEPLLPYNLASFVTAILGLSNYGPFVSDVAKPSSYDAPQQGNSNSCVADFGLTNGCHLPSFFARTYNLRPLYARANGSGQTVGIVTLAAVDSGAPEYFWSNIADVNRTGSLTVDNVDGGPGAPSSTSGSGETDLDIEQSGALAPGANVIDYQAPNTDYAYTASQDLGTTNLSVDNPADSPYITACGGTSLPGTTYLSGANGTATATTTANRIWGWDYLWGPIAQVSGVPLAEVAESNVVGSGGGFSVIEPEPSYQREVSGTSRPGLCRPSGQLNRSATAAMAGAMARSPTLPKPMTSAGGAVASATLR
jgi:subtilase family serine protease